MISYQFLADRISKKKRQSLIQTEVTMVVAIGFEGSANKLGIGIIRDGEVSERWADDV